MANYTEIKWMGNHNVHKDHRKETITVFADLFFYGSKASASLAKQMARDVGASWNGPKAVIEISKIRYHVHFSVRGFYTTVPQKWIIGNTDYKRMFIKVVPRVDVYGFEIDVSRMSDLSTNSGLFKYDNIKKPGSTTEAHELGHGWGLTHPSKNDYRGKGRPSIMVARGASVDSQYQYDPNAKRKQPGSTMDPDKRHVTQQDVEALALTSLSYDPLGRASLGSLTNKIYDEPTQVQVEIFPAAPLPGPQTVRFGEKGLDSFLVIEGKSHKIDLDKAGFIGQAVSNSQNVPLTLSLPVFGTESEATKYTAHRRTDLGVFRTGRPCILVVANEVPAVAEYMIKEMQTNAKSKHVEGMLALNKAADQLRKQGDTLFAKASKSIQEEARHRWSSAVPKEAKQDIDKAVKIIERSSRLSSQVKEIYQNLADYGKPWDHKPYLRQMWGAWHTWGKWEYFYDVWSNIHYGYVGRVAGFSEKTLVEAASVAGRLEDLKQLRLMSAWKGDPKSDVIAIQKGCQMFDQKRPMTAESLIKIIEQTLVFIRRPRSFNSNEECRSIHLK